MRRRVLAEGRGGEERRGNARVRGSVNHCVPSAENPASGVPAVVWSGQCVTMWWRRSSAAGKLDDCALSEVCLSGQVGLVSH